MGNNNSRARRPSQTAGVINSETTPVIGIPVAPPEAVAPAVPNPDSEQVALMVSSEKEALDHRATHDLLCMCSIKAPPAPQQEQRPPIDLVACIDRSGSMYGDKMRLMKQTLELLVKRSGLKAGDRIGLVTFDSNVRLDMPLEFMDGNGRAKAEGVIKAIHPGSTTNLSGGALKAIDVIDASAPEKGRTRAVMLFTDGLANEGIRNTTHLVQAVSGALSAASTKVGGPISLYTFGFGSDHNEDCLRALATGSGAGGLYYHVSTAEDIPNAFADCLGGLTSVVAQNAALSFRPAAGVSVTRVLGAAYTRDAEGAVVLGDLFADDEKDVLLELKLPTLTAPTNAQEVLHATIRAFNVARVAPDVITTCLTIARPERTPGGQPVNAAIDVQRNRIQAAAAMEEASRLADMGNVGAGQQLLQLTRQRIADSASAEAALSLELVRECQQLEEVYTSAEAYRSVGSKMSKMSAMSHSRQRATHSSVASYGAGAKRKAALKAQWSSAAGDDSE